MELIITIIVAIIAIRVFMKVTSFIIRFLLIAAILFGVWYFQADILEQLSGLIQFLHLEPFFATLFEWLQNIGQSIWTWLNDLISFN